MEMPAAIAPKKIPWVGQARTTCRPSLLDIVTRHVSALEEQMQFHRVIGKLINLEQQFVLEAYEKENIARREKLYSEIKEDLKKKIAAVSEDATNMAKKHEATVQRLKQSSKQVHRSFEYVMSKTQEVRNMTDFGKEQLRQLIETVSRIVGTSLEMAYSANDD